MHRRVRRPPPRKGEQRREGHRPHTDVPGLQGNVPGHCGGVPRWSARGSNQPKGARPARLASLSGWCPRRTAWATRYNVGRGGRPGHGPASFRDIRPRAPGSRSSNIPRGDHFAAARARPAHLPTCPRDGETRGDPAEERSPQLISAGMGADRETEQRATSNASFRSRRGTTRAGHLNTTTSGSGVAPTTWAPRATGVGSRRRLASRPRWTPSMHPASCWSLPVAPASSPGGWHRARSG